MTAGARERGSEGAKVCVMTFLDESGRVAIDLKAIQAVVDAALAEDGMEACALTVLIVDDAESARLHREHFDVDGTTDVMTFPDDSTDPETGLHLLGDLAVCAEVALREALERGRSASDELTLYVLHGLLHLLGYDDEDPADQAEMWAVQRRLLATVGIRLEAEPS
jgi:probable rRNA maturation factor